MFGTEVETPLDRQLLVGLCGLDDITDVVARVISLVHPYQGWIKPIYIAELMGGSQRELGDLIEMQTRFECREPFDGTNI